MNDIKFNSVIDSGLLIIYIGKICKRLKHVLHSERLFVFYFKMTFISGGGISDMN